MHDFLNSMRKLTKSIDLVTVKSNYLNTADLYIVTEYNLHVSRV